MPSWFGGGCLGWILFVLFWTVVTVVFPIVIIGWVIIIGAALAALGGSGGA